MIRKTFEAFLVLCGVFVALHLWHAHHEPNQNGDWHVPANPGALPPPVIPPVGGPPPPLEESPIVEEPQEKPAEKPPAKKHFWQRAPKNEAENGSFPPDGQAAAEDIRRRMTPDEYRLPLPDAHFSGAKFFLWDHGCEPGERLLRQVCEYAARRGYTVGDGPQFDIWVIRVPANSEECPHLKFYHDGRELPPEMIGDPGSPTFIFGRIPRTNPHILQREPLQPGPLSRANGPRVPHYGPGIGVEYGSNTHIGVGIGFGDGWRPRNGG